MDSVNEDGYTLTFSNGLIRKEHDLDVNGTSLIHPRRNYLIKGKPLLLQRRVTVNSILYAKIAYALRLLNPSKNFGNRRAMQRHPTPARVTDAPPSICETTIGVLITRTLWWSLHDTRNHCP